MHSAIEGHKLCCTLELPIELLKCWLPQTHPRPITWVPGAGPRHPRQLQPAWAPSSSNCAVGTSTGHLSWQPVGYSVVLSFGGFPGGSEVKASACNVGDLGSIPGLGRSPGEGNGNSLQYSCLEIMDRGIYFIHSISSVYIIPNLPILPTPPFPPLVSIHLFSTFVSLFLFCK